MQVSDYKVKIMIAEPKGKRGRRDPLFSEAFAHAIQQPGLDYGNTHLGPFGAMSEPSMPSQCRMSRLHLALQSLSCATPVLQRQLTSKCLLLKRSAHGIAVDLTAGL